MYQKYGGLFGKRIRIVTTDGYVFIGKCDDEYYMPDAEPEEESIWIDAEEVEVGSPGLVGKLVEVYLSEVAEITVL